MTFYERTHTKFYDFYILRLLSLAIASTLMQIVLIVSSQSVLYHKVYFKSIVVFINLYKLAQRLPVPTVRDICPHLTVCLSFRVDLSKKQESGIASLTCHVTNQICN